MPTLLEKITASARARLPLPPGRKPSQELVRYKNFLKVESHRLRILHRAGAGGREICQARAAILDLLLQYILQAVEANMPPEAAKHPPFALVAIGGYGRAELNPQSDIDIMFLHDGQMVVGTKLHPYFEALTGAGGLLYTLYDINLKVGHSARSVEDCVRIANSDMQSKTSLIEARLIQGDQKLFDDMQRTVLAKCIRGHEEEYIKERLADQESRRAKHGNSACMQEPNIKNGSGGLRDYQNLIWMTYFKYRYRTLNELEKAGQISAAERRQLVSAYDFLLRVRNDLHYQTGRPVDVMPKIMQPTIATDLGYGDRSPRVRLEKFMRDLYVHMRNIYLITRTVEQRLALLPLPERRLPSWRDIIRSRRQWAMQVVDGFQFIDGQIVAASNRVFREQPRRLMRVFLHSQQRGLPLHPDLTQLIRQSLALVNKEFIQDPHVHETFLEILNQRGNVAPILRAMHEVDFLGKYLPEFGRLTCLVQHEFYHQYAADEHTLMCIEMLDRVWDAKEAPFSRYTEMFQGIERPFVLYLALLLHDAAKSGKEDKHAVAGAKLAGRVAERLDLDDKTKHTLRLLVEQHLTMIQISQWRDMDDAAVIRNFAQLIQTPEQLTMLALHTFADSLGTSSTLWNDFKDTLLNTLYRKTMELLSGSTDFQQAEERHRESLAKEVRKMVPGSFKEDEVQAHFDSLPVRYFNTHSPRGIVADLSMVHRFMHLQFMPEERALEPVVAWHNEPDRGYTALKICTWDRTGLFSKICGSLTAAGLNILSAQIFSRNDGIILDTFFVNDALKGKVASKEEREIFEKRINEALNEGLDLSALIAKRKSPAPLYQSVAGECMPTIIEFDNDTSETRTVIDVQTEDRVGLLYDISLALSALNMDISVAKIGTEKGAAVDSFYVAEEDGSKVISAERKKLIDKRLRWAIHHGREIK